MYSKCRGVLLWFLSCVFFKSDKSICIGEINSMNFVHMRRELEVSFEVSRNAKMHMDLSLCSNQITITQ